MEGARRVYHDLQTRRLGYFIEGILLGDVGDNDNLEAIGLGLVRIADLLSLVLRSNRRDDSVAGLEELFENVGYTEKGVSETPWWKLFKMGKTHRQ